MKLTEAMKIIEGGEKEKEPGYMIDFEKVVGGMLHSGHFPEPGEPLIETEEEAWELAKRFAAQTKGRYVNIYVIGSDFCPVKGYEKKMIKNRD